MWEFIIFGGERHRHLHGVFFSTPKVAGFLGRGGGLRGLWGFRVMELLTCTIR